MKDDLTICTVFVSEHWEITVTQRGDTVELDMDYLVDGERVRTGAGACLSPRFAKELGTALQHAGFAVDLENGLDADAEDD